MTKVRTGEQSSTLLRTTGEQLTTIIDNLMELEAVEPAYRRLIADGDVGKAFVLENALIVAHRQRSRIDKCDACACAIAGGQTHKGSSTEGISSTKRV